MCDTYLWGKVGRISPEAPVPIFESVERRQVLGGAANVAANLRALGCDVRLLGVIGADADWALHPRAALCTGDCRYVAHTGCAPSDHRENTAHRQSTTALTAGP